MSEGLPDIVFRTFMPRSTAILLTLTLLVGLLSLLAGAADVSFTSLLSGDAESLELLLISR